MLKYLAKYKLFILLNLLIIFIMPLCIIVIVSLSSRENLIENTFSISNISLRNYAEILKEFPIIRWTLNTIFVAVLSVLGGLISSVSVAYALTHFEWRFKKSVFLLICFTFLIPVQITTISLYKIYAGIGWIPSFKALIVPFFLTDPISVLILRQFLMQVPINLGQVARIEGVSEIKIFFKIILPLLRPALIANGLLIFLGSWNDLYQPLLYTIENPNLWTLPIGLAQIQGIHNVNPNLTMAAAALFILPVIGIFLLMQRRLLTSFDFSSTIVK